MCIPYGYGKHSLIRFGKYHQHQPSMVETNRKDNLKFSFTISRIYKDAKATRVFNDAYSVEKGKWAQLSMEISGLKDELDMTLGMN
jgi:hypothetical protein